MSSAARRPPIPLSPVLSGASLRRTRAAPVQGVLDAGQVRLVTSARVAIGLALAELGIGPGDTVLLPAYHSPSMVGPVRWRGATPVFYKVRKDTAIDAAQVEACLGPSTRALVVTHYFGFAQAAIGALRALCDRHRIALIEDCAHALIGSHAGQPLGSWGDYAAASIMKFLPLYDGGALVSSRHSLQRVALRSAGPGFEAKAAVNALERGFAHGRLGPLRAGLWLPLRLRDALRGRGRPLAAAPAAADSGTGFEAAWVDKRASWFSRALLRGVALAPLAAARRAHYLQLEDAVRGLPGGAPLFAALPDDTCPWMFPLRTREPERVFAHLRAAAVPVTRFAHGVDTAGCAASADLARTVIALPCHQELTLAELAHIIGALREALR